MNRPHLEGCPNIDCHNNKDCCPFRKIVIPSVMGGDSEGEDYAPENGAYRNALVEYEANGALYLYSSDGIYTKLSLAANDFGMATIRYVDQKDAETLVAAKQYTDEHGGGGGEDDLFYINVTNVDFSEGTFTADKTYAEILEAYNAGKLPIVIVKEEDSSYRYNGVYILRSYGVNEESDGFDFAYANATGGEGRVEAGSWVIHIGNGYNRANESYGSVEIDNALSQYSNHAVKNSAVYEALSQKVSQAELAAVATSGSYNDLSNKPTIPAAQVQSNWTQTTTTAVDYIKNKPTLATVATSGSYNDLSNKPTIPTVNNATLTIQKNGTTVKTFTANASSNVTANITVPTKTSDLTNDSGFLDSVAWGDVTGKPTLATVATSGSYNDLSNKPTIPTVNNATLTIQKNGTTVGTFTANASSNATANITVPTKTSDVTNDSGFLTPSTLPIAGAGVLGAISVGAGLEISSSGVLSATGGGTADAVAWGHVTGTLADQTDLQTALNGKQASLSTAQLDAANSGITSAKVSTYDGYASTIARKANSADVPVITMQTTDPGEGATLAANTFIGVYNG